MKQFLKGVFEGVDGLPSSKRLAMLWMIVIVWSFIHYAVFFLIKPFPTDTAATLILYDFLMIMGFGGMNVSERIWDKTDKPKTEDKPQDQTK